MFDGLLLIGGEDVAINGLAVNPTKAYPSPIWNEMKSKSS
jgi:hypothetical protein